VSFGDKVTGWLRGAFLDNAAIKFVSLVLAVTIFILVNTGQDVDIGVTVPVRYTMPKDRVLVSERVDQVRLSIRGSWRRTKRFDEREIEPITVDMTARGDGLLLFQEDMIRLPHGLELLSIAPQSAPLRFEPGADGRVASLACPSVWVLGSWRPWWHGGRLIAPRPRRRVSCWSSRPPSWRRIAWMLGGASAT